MVKLKREKPTKITWPDPAFDPVDLEPHYHIVSALKIDELIVMVNHQMVIHGYKPSGGAVFSDQLGIWTQTLIK